jgi:hypothetical protein
MMIRYASACWKLPTETSVYGDKLRLFLIPLPLTTSCISTALETSADQFRRAGSCK